MIKPWLPIKPIEPTKTITVKEIVYDNMNFGHEEVALIDIIDINKLDAYIISNFPGLYYEYTKIYYEEQIENPNYELQIEDYKIKLIKYEKELKKYNLSLNLYNKNLKKEKQDKINKLKEELKVLEQDII